MSSISENVKKILEELPPNVKLLAAAKTRNNEEIEEAIRSGVGIIGENYVQEAEENYPLVREKARWHYIGHMQKNKINKILKIFDVVETIDSLDMAKALDDRCVRSGKTMEILVEVNSAREEQKSGAMPEVVEKTIEELSKLENVKVMGLMTMGPLSENPEDLRPYFRITRELFDKIKSSQMPGVEMKYLSMGMSDSYKVAIEEGANLVRIGSKIFGPRR